MKKDINQLFFYPRSWVDSEASDIAKSVRQWANKEIVNNRLDYMKDYKNLFIKAHNTLATEIGFQGLLLPEKAGGIGFNTLGHAPALVTILMEAARADAGIAFIHALEYVVSSLFTLPPYKNDYLCDWISQIFNTETLAAVCVVLPGAGNRKNNAPLFCGRSIQARIASGKEGDILSGGPIRPIGNGANASLYCVVCADEKCVPQVVLIKDNKSIVKSQQLKQTGLDGCGNADLTFDSMPVNRRAVIKRSTAVYELYTLLNLLLGAVSIGSSIGCLEILYEWAEKRTIKGGSLLKENPLCAAVLAHITEETAVAKLLVYNLAHAVAHPEEWGERGSLPVFTLAQMMGNRIQKCCLNAVNRIMELMASQGYAKEGGVEKPWRDIKTIQSHLCGIGADVPVKMDIARYFFDCKKL